MRTTPLSLSLMALVFAGGAPSQTIRSIPETNTIIVESEYQDQVRRVQDWVTAFHKLNPGANLSLILSRGESVKEYANLYDVTALGSLLKITIKLSGERRSTLFVRPEDILEIRDNPQENKPD